MTNEPRRVERGWCQRGYWGDIWRKSKIFLVSPCYLWVQLSDYRNYCIHRKRGEETTRSFVFDFVYIVSDLVVRTSSETQTRSGTLLTLRQCSVGTDVSWTLHRSGLTLRHPQFMCDLKFLNDNRCTTLLLQNLYNPIYIPLLIK